MTGEKDLQKIIRSMNPQLNAGEYVFCILDKTRRLEDIEAIGSFREQEGLSVILAREKADQTGLCYSFVCAWITLNIHSALDAVGLTAVVAKALAQEGISCNVVAAYHHDHLFVPIRDGERAMRILQNLCNTK